MMNKIIFGVIIYAGFILGTTLYFTLPQSSPIENLVNSSVVVKDAEGYGSGFTVLHNNEVYVITAAHCLEPSIIEDEYTGEVTFKHVEVLHTQNNITYSVTGEVIKYNRKLDIGVIKLLDKSNFHFTSTKFYLSKTKPKLATDVLTVGNNSGAEVPHAVSKGIISSHDLFVRGNSYDILAITGKSGASGSGVFLLDGRLVGMICIGNKDIRYGMLPVRTIIKWADDNDMSWLYNE